MMMMKMKANTIKKFIIFCACLAVALSAICVACFGLDSLLSLYLGAFSISSIIIGAFSSIYSQVENIKASAKSSDSFGNIKSSQIQVKSTAQSLNSAKNIKSCHVEQGETSNDEKKDKIPYASRFLQGARISFAPFRLLGYVILVVALISLLEYELFFLSAFSLGLFCGLILCILFVFLSFYRDYSK